MQQLILCALRWALPVLLPSITSCSGQPVRTAPESDRGDVEATPRTGAQLDEYVVEVFEDKSGNLWFGTLSKGVARYDGNALTWFSTIDGLCGNTVTSLAEDAAGNLWIGTHSGLSRYDGWKFTNYTTRNGLCNDRVSDLLIDTACTVWIATWDGVCRFDGTGFTKIELPIPDVPRPGNAATINWVTELLEDRQGHIWICRDGYGACRYDGTSFTCLTKRDGLPSNNVQAIAEDRSGHIWFGCRIAERDNPDPNARTGDGGVARYDGRSLVQFPQYEGLTKNETYAIHADRAGNVWIGANGLGVYRYDGKDFRLFRGTDRMDLTQTIGIQDILGDRNGNLWFGLSGGLFRLKGNAIVNVTVNGPWN